jgi:hypothetical protein
MITNIININDVETFFHRLLDEGLNLHPDEDFMNYVNTDTSLPTYTNYEAVERNHQMELSFEVCEKANVDIYDLALEIFLKRTGLDKYIPLPSSLE